MLRLRYGLLILRNFRTLLPNVRITPLNLFSASTVNLYGASITNMFHKNLKVRLSPLKGSLISKALTCMKIYLY